MRATLQATVRTGVQIQLVGDVQGCGIRPTVANLAMQCDLLGSVRNSRQGVDIVLYGTREAIDVFQESLRMRFSSATQKTIAIDTFEPMSGFQILESVFEGEVQFVIPRDRVTCADCLRECQTPGDRRFGYALIGCAQCGPRYSIIRDLPYDRSQTSMSAFAMCSDCQAEFVDPAHRRFHAQTNCCPKCGPMVWFESNGEILGHGDVAVAAAARDIRNGRILAMKGLGGYQLVCDATNCHAIERLRSRKNRITKPLAVMASSMDEAHAIVEFNALDEETLKGPAGPIVLLQSRTQNYLASNIHTGFPSIGIMLPTTALHMMLLKETKIPLVVTSGNIEGEPLEYRETEATLRLSGIADCFLHHNRPIVNPIDDSVVQSIAGRMVTHRAARGIAPIPIEYRSESQVLALGGHQKAAVALSNGYTTILGPHIGDLDTVRTRDRFLEQKAMLQSLLRVKSPMMVCDQHLDFFTSQLADEDSGRNCHAVQHHHAHIVSAMVEHGWLDSTVLGFAFDGTGLGCDGSIWGGEVLVATTASFKRVGHLRTFPLLGGELAVKQPWRIALALLVDAIGEEQTLEIVDANKLRDWQVDRLCMQRLLPLLDRNALSLQTSSMGRLFDGVAALVCGIGQVSFEGEAAMRLEAVCNQDVQQNYHISVSRDSPCEMDWRPMVIELIADLASDVPVGTIAMKFHRAIAECIATISHRYRDFPVVLAGGVFQNRNLVELVDRQLHSLSMPYAMPCQVPPNDGGLALGQLVIATSRMERAVCV